MPAADSASSAPRFGALFDWDGVIIDSAEYHLQSWLRLAAEIDKPFSEVEFRRSFGMRNVSIIPEVLHWSTDMAEILDLSDRKEAHYRDILVEGGVQPLPGVVPFLERLVAAGIPRTVGSSTSRLNIQCALGAMGLERFFGEFVCGDDVSRGKPDPEVFLKASDKIGVKPAHCIVFEDAHVGIAAALAGGMRVVGVATTHPAASLTEAHRVVHRLDELTIADLDALVHGG